MIRIEKVLVPTDFSTHSEKAVTYGVEIAAKFGAQLHVLHAVEQVPILYGEGGGVAPETEADLKAAASKQLELIPESSPDGLDVVRSVVIGNPFMQILKYAEDISVDLIVIGTHGRTAVARVLLGSVAEKIVRKSPCPVLTLRDDTHDFVMT